MIGEQAKQKLGDLEGLLFHLYARLLIMSMAFSGTFIRQVLILLFELSKFYYEPMPGLFFFDPERLILKLWILVYMYVLVFFEEEHGSNASCKVLLKKNKCHCSFVLHSCKHVPFCGSFS